MMPSVRVANRASPMFVLSNCSVTSEVAKGQAGVGAEAEPQHLPPCELSDSHIVEPEGSAVLDALEVIEPSSHDEWAGFAIVTGPSSEAADHPGSKGE